MKVGLAYDVGGRGDQSFNDSAAAGLDKAKAAGVVITDELEASNGETDANKEDRLRQLADKGATVIIAVGFAYATPLSTVAPDYPKVHFAIIDDAGLCDAAREGGAVPNVACLTFAEEQGSYLVGVAAALKSKTGKVGYIGGVNTPLLQKFQAGFEAGVKATKADATVESKYISEPPDFSGFNAPDKGETIAKGMYSGGADIIYAAAGGSGAGVFKAAKAAKTFGIGVDSDQYNVPALADVKDVIMTSMVKNVDVAVYADVVAAVNGKPLTGQKVYDLKTGGISYSTSGGFVTDIEPQLKEAEAKIVSGEIKVPTTPGS
ncbi:MAG: BMP family ABC transporter substrate-binding protein [Nakamurella sp.]